MTLINPAHIDYKKYKRLFTFGCSFTFYRYPTWANIIRKNMPDAEFYNFAASGAGNLMISNRITEISRKFEFNETDLVMVMWSTHCREDRFKNRAWLPIGNIFSQTHYDEEFVKTHCDPLGYLIKDLSLIDLTTTYLRNNPADYFQMMSVPVTYQHDGDNITIKNDVLETYQSLISSFKLSLLESLPDQKWPTHISYFDDFSNRTTREYHPTPLQYYEYLCQLDFPMTDTSKEYAVQADQYLSKVKKSSDLVKHFYSEARFEIKGSDTNDINGYIGWLVNK